MEMPKDELLGYLNSRIYPNHGSSNKSKKFTGSVKVAELGHHNLA